MKYAILQDMEGFNKILSLFIGLFVVIIVMFLVVRRFNLQKTWPLFGGNSDATKKNTATTSPTPTKAVVAINQTSDTIKEKFNNTTTYTGTSYEQKSQNNTSTSQINSDTALTKGTRAQSIPETGAPTALLPLMFTSLTLGIYLRKKS